MDYGAIIIFFRFPSSRLKLCQSQFSHPVSLHHPSLLSHSYVYWIRLSTYQLRDAHIIIFQFTTTLIVWCHCPHSIWVRKLQFIGQKHEHDSMLQWQVLITFDIREGKRKTEKPIPNWNRSMNEKKNRKMTIESIPRTLHPRRGKMIDKKKRRRHETIDTMISWCTKRDDYVNGILRKNIFQCEKHFFVTNQCVPGHYEYGKSSSGIYAK